ncbi:MAG: PD-(D/E)XK nuclease family protein [Candidatus Gracilibacteria bacterium]|nr:PD-(D/E)XK nuclease family protein [Candidatus Gracilibacteria bacterium]
MYNPPRTRNLFNPASKEAFRLSRSKLDLFLNCPRCFYLDRRLGVDQVPGYPFSLNSAVDALLKKEFDLYRERGEAHPEMSKAGIEAVPYQDARLEEWRDALRGGITFLHPESKFLVTGGIDDVWVNKQGELIIVDYKATSKKEEVNLDADWQIGYKRQMEIYQWLFRQNGFRVSKTGYFVYCNGDTSKDSFDKKLEFEIKIIPYTGKDDWIGAALVAARKCLEGNKLPQASPDCDFCKYRQAAKEAEDSSVNSPQMLELFPDL